MSERLQIHKCSNSTTGPLISHQSKLLDKNRKLLVSQPPLIQAKLAINQPGDEYEQEADRVAEQFMRMPGGGTLQRKCAKCDEDKNDVMQTKESPRQLPETQGQDVPPIVHEVLRSPGQILDSSTRAYMEPRFGHDFSKVRVHADSKAAESAREVNALAYTLGRNVVFGEGQYEPGTSAGRRLIAHELTHVTQQHENRVIQSKLEIGQPGNTFEKEADQAAEQIILGQYPLLNYEKNRPVAPSKMILTYRKKGEMNFGKLDEPGLKEEEFVNSKTQPWIEQITLKFDGAKTDSAGDLVATGTLKATYNANKAALSDISINIVGGSTKLGLTDKGKGFKVHRIEGVGYNDVIPADPEGKSWPKSKYSKSLNASMHYAVFFKGKQAVHAGSLDIGSHSCIHVDWTNLHTIRQINYHSVEGRTKVDVSYDSAALKTLCCSRMKILGVTKKGDAPNPCQGEDPKACP